MANVASPTTAHGWGRAAAAGGVVAGIVGSAVLALTQATIGMVVYLLVSLAYGSVHAGPALRLRRAAWAVLKLGAYPFVGPRSLDPGFDGRIVLLGVGTCLAFSIGSGALFGLAAHGRHRSTTIALGLVWGIAMWAVNSYFVFPPIRLSVGAIVEFIPYSVALAVTFLWYERPRIPHA
jgi:hypothetical protein